MGTGKNFGRLGVVFVSSTVQGSSVESHRGRRSKVGEGLAGHLIPAKVVDQRLHVGEDTLGVRLLAHDHHVLYLQQGHTISKGPETEMRGQRVRWA